MFCPLETFLVSCSSGDPSINSENKSAAPPLEHTPSSTHIHLPRDRRLPLFGLMAVAFFTTCGGPFGLEPLPAAVGPGWAVVLILAAPLLWSLPMALMVAELSTLLPEEGGYYVWVRETMGPFWGVQEAWWTMGYSIGLMASFPVLFVSYASYFIPALAPGVNATHPVLLACIRWALAAAFILSAMAVNLLGARDVGRSSKIGAGFVLGAFALLVITWLVRGTANHAVAGIMTRDLATSNPRALLLGLSLISFNFSGWDNVSTFAAEVDRPQRNYPIALGGALLALVLSYLLPMLAGLSVTTSPAIWNTDSGWPVIARLIGGAWLGAMIAAAGVVSMWALFNAQLLYVSRLPFVMARDRWLPQLLAKVSPHSSVPKVAILIFCGITAVFAALPFGSLAIITCLLYTPALVLEFLALIILRVRRPNAPHSFRIPGGWWGMSAVCAAFFAGSLLVVAATLREWRSYPGQLLVVGFVIFTGVALYLLRRRVALSAAGPPGAVNTD
jgi:amino acid transporter